MLAPSHSGCIRMRQRGAVLCPPPLRAAPASPPAHAHAHAHAGHDTTGAAAAQTSIRIWSRSALAAPIQPPSAVVAEERGAACARWRSRGRRSSRCTSQRDRHRQHRTRQQLQLLQQPLRLWQQQRPPPQSLPLPPPLLRLLPLLPRLAASPSSGDSSRRSNARKQRPSWRPIRRCTAGPAQARS